MGIVDEALGTSASSPTPSARPNKLRSIVDEALSEVTVRVAAPVEAKTPEKPFIVNEADIMDEKGTGSSAALALLGGLVTAPLSGLAGLAAMIGPSPEIASTPPEFAAVPPLERFTKGAGLIQSGPGGLITNPRELAIAKGAGDILSAPFVKAGDIASDIVTLKAFAPEGEINPVEQSAWGRALGAGAGAAGELLPFLAFGGMGKLKTAVESSAWYRGLTIKEKGLVTVSLEDMLKTGMSEGEILKKWVNPTWREEALQRRKTFDPTGMREAPLGQTLKTPPREPLLPERGLPVGQGFELKGQPFSVGDTFVADLMRKAAAIPGAAALPPGQGFELRGQPFDPVEALLKEKLAETQGTLALPLPEGMGEGFTVKDVSPDVIRHRPEPEPDYYAAPANAAEGVIVETAPKLTKSGAPFKTEQAARTAMTRLGVAGDVVPFKDGFGIKKAKPSIVEEALAAAPAIPAPSVVPKPIVKSAKAAPAAAEIVPPVVAEKVTPSKPAVVEEIHPDVKTLILTDMKEALETGEFFGTKQENVGQGWENKYVGSSNPPWLMDIAKEFKAKYQQTIGKPEILTVIKKELEGKGNTFSPKQLKLWFMVEDHVKGQSFEPHYVRAGEIMSGASKGLVDEFNTRMNDKAFADYFGDLEFPPTEKEVAKAASEVVIEEKRNGNEDTLQSYQAGSRGEGKADDAPIPAKTPKTEKTGQLTQTVIPGASEAETFNLTGAPGEIGTPAPKGAVPETGKLFSDKSVDSVREGGVQYDILRNNPEYKGRTNELNIAEKAINEIRELEGPGNLSQAPGRVAGPREAGGITTHGIGISADLVKKGRIDLRGQSARNFHEIAVLAEVYRNPRFETLRYIYVKGGKVVAHEGVTSRLPGSSAIFVKNPEKEIYEINRRIERLGADGVYLVHNHPSGDPTPSFEDVSLTQRIGVSLKGKVKGHVVINHKKYAFIPSGNDPVVTHQYGQGAADALTSPAIAHNFIGQSVDSPASAATWARSIYSQGDRSIILYRNAKGKIRAIQEVPVGLVKNPKALEEYIKGRKLEFGSVGAIVVSKSQNINHLSLQGLVNRGVIEDSISIRGQEYKSVREDVPYHPVREEMKAFKVREESPEYGNFSIRRIRDSIDEHKLVVDKGDLKWTQKIWNNPHNIAKKHPAFKPIYERELAREEGRSSMLVERLKGWESARELKPESLTKLRTLIWRAEGKTIKGVTENRYLWKKDAEGRFTIKGMNEKRYTQMTDTLSKNHPADVVKAFVDFQRHFDKARGLVYNKMRRMKDVEESTIERFRKEIGQIENYFPHNRYGNYYIRAFDKDGNIVFRTHFNDLAPGGISIRARGLLDQYKKQYPDGVKWEVDKVRGLPEEIYEFPIPVEAMEQIINAAADRIGDADAKAAIKGAMPEAIADVLKSRGFGSHMIKRQDIPGWEKDDILRVAYDFDSGMTGWLTKIDAANAFSDLLRQIDAKKLPTLWGYSSRYVRDVLANTDRTDLIVDNVRAVLYMKYLGGVIKTGVVNLTQNLITGMPRLGVDVGFANSNRYFGSAASDIRAALTKGKNLSADETKALEELYRKGITSDQYTREAMGKIAKKAGKAMLMAKTVMGLPMSISERFNRSTLALAAFRLASNGKIINPKALARYGLEKGKKAPYDAALEFAKDVVEDAHFVYGKGNYPELMRGTTKFLKPMYTLQSFNHNLMQLWGWMYRQGGPGWRAFFQSMLWTLILGGLKRLPFFGVLFALYRQLTGKDPETELRKRIADAPGDNKNLYRDIVTHGVPAGAGIDIGGSLDIGTIDISNPLKAIVGVPYSTFYDEPKQAIRALEMGENLRALEAVAPTVIKNPMAARRLATEGHYSVSGQPINLPGETGPRKLSTLEAVAKGFGFQPVSSTKANDAQKVMMDLQEFVQSKKQKFASRYVNAYNEGDIVTMSKVNDEVNAWNEKWEKEGESQFKISIRDAVRTRMGNRKPPKALRGEAREIGEVFK